MKDLKKRINMHSRTKDTDYLYASAYIRAIEERGLSRELLVRMMNAQSGDACEAVVKETFPEYDVDAVFDAVIEESFDTIAEAVPDMGVLDFLRYQYDANNIKLAIKCASAEHDTDGLYYSCGTLPVSAYTKAAEIGDYSALPGRLAEAAADAAVKFASTGDPQIVDIIIDRAALESMADAADGTGSGFIKNAVACRIDIANITAAVRIIRMGGENAASMIGKVCADGGIIPTKRLVLPSVQELIDVVGGYYPKLAASLADDIPNGTLERITENFYLETVYSAKKIPFGCEIPFAYLVSAEYNAKNARIILAGKRFGMKDEKITERMRSFYV